MTKLKPCVCGTDEPPRMIRRGTRSHVVSMQCPSCKRRTPITRVEHADEAWNQMVIAIEQRAAP